MYGVKPAGEGNNGRNTSTQQEADEICQLKRKEVREASSLMDARRFASSILRAHSLPEGLLPLWALESFTISGKTHEIDARLSTIVETSNNGKLVRFGTHVTGIITHCRISKVRGVEFQKGGKWLRVDAIRMDFSDPETPMVCLYAGPVWGFLSPSRLMGAVGCSAAVRQVPRSATMNTSWRGS